MKFDRETLASLTKTGRGEYGIGASAVEYSPDLLTYLRITDINDDGHSSMCTKLGIPTTHLWPN